MKGECRAYPEIDSGRKAILVPGDPVFLFRATQTDPYQIGMGGSDFFADAFEFIFRPLTEGGRMGAGNDGPGETGSEDRGQLSESFLLST